VEEKDPIQVVNGKKLIIGLGIGAFIFSVVMGFGTYGMAKIMAPILSKNAPKPTQGALHMDDHEKNP
jgi:hypothetical protein